MDENAITIFSIILLAIVIMYIAAYYEESPTKKKVSLHDYTLTGRIKIYKRPRGIVIYVEHLTNGESSFQEGTVKELKLLKETGYI